MNGQSRIPPPIGDDTIELVLTPEQLLVLSQAAEQAQAVAPALICTVAAPARKAPAFSPPQPLPEVSPSGRLRRWHPTSIAKIAGAMAAYFTLAWWSASQLAGQPKPPITAATRPAVVMPRPTFVTTSSKPAVRVINPFDATEVFEFPAGTSAAAGREQAARILWQRARERQSQWEHIKPAASIRTASLYRSP